MFPESDNYSRDLDIGNRVGLRFTTRSQSDEAAGSAVSSKLYQKNCSPSDVFEVSAHLCGHHFSSAVWNRNELRQYLWTSYEMLAFTMTHYTFAIQC